MNVQFLDNMGKYMYGTFSTTRHAVIQALTDEMKKRKQTQT